VPQGREIFPFLTVQENLETALAAAPRGSKVPGEVFDLFPILREHYWLAAIFAALIGLSLSMLFLRRPLDEVSTGLSERREERRRNARDESVEDAATD
jgi:ABC-type branched-subunit amino acid transport system ATPase component